ncbi:MAG: hypothetical protein ACJ767_01365, partial [Chloroflexota bacterium]
RWSARARAPANVTPRLRHRAALAADRSGGDEAEGRHGVGLGRVGADGEVDALGASHRSGAIGRADRGRQGARAQRAQRQTLHAPGAAEFRLAGLDEGVRASPA